MMLDAKVNYHSPSILPSPIADALNVLHHLDRPTGSAHCLQIMSTSSTVREIKNEKNVSVSSLNHH